MVFIDGQTMSLSEMSANTVKPHNNNLIIRQLKVGNDHALKLIVVFLS